MAQRWARRAEDREVPGSSPHSRLTFQSCSRYQLNQLRSKAASESTVRKSNTCGVSNNRLYFRWTMFQVTSAYTNASTLYSECSSVGWTMFQVTSAYTNACTLYTECSSVRWTMFHVTSAYTNASTLYSECSSVRVDYVPGYLCVYQCMYFIQ